MLLLTGADESARVTGVFESPFSFVLPFTPGKLA